MPGMAASARAHRSKTAVRPLTRETYTHLAERLVDQVGLEIVAVDAEGKVTLVNRQAARRLADPVAAVGRPFLEVFPLFAEKVPVDWRQVLARNVLAEGRSVEVRGHVLGGRASDVRIFPLAEGKRRVGAAILIEDVTERVAREGELLRQAKTASLANLGASIAHEIRNPLNSIALNIQLLKEDLAKKGTRSQGATVFQTIDTTLNGIERLNKIIKEFLQFSRPPQVVLKLDDPNRAVLSALQLLEGEIRKAGVDVTVSLSPLPRILVDVERLSEAIYNVALNAVQAMGKLPAGAPRVMTVTSGAEGDHAAIRVADTGPGIPADVQARVFDLFFTTREGGTGLGLPYADGVVKAHQGRIQVESAPGAGTAFTILLPLSIRMAKDAR